MFAVLRHTQACANSRRATYTYLFPFLLAYSLLYLWPKLLIRRKSDLSLSRNRDEEIFLDAVRSVLLKQFQNSQCGHKKRSFPRPEHLAFLTTQIWHCCLWDSGQLIAMQRSRGRQGNLPWHLFHLAASLTAAVTDGQHFCLKHLSCKIETFV